MFAKNNTSLYVDVSHHDDFCNSRSDQISSGEGSNFSVAYVDLFNGEDSDGVTTCDEVPRENLIGIELGERLTSYYSSRRQPSSQAVNSP